MTGGWSHLTLSHQGEGRGTPVGQEAPNSPPPFPLSLSVLHLLLSVLHVFLLPSLSDSPSLIWNHQLGLGVEVGVRVGGKGSKGCRGEQWGASEPIPYTSPWLSIAMATRMYWAGRGGDKAGGWTGTSWGELGPEVPPRGNRRWHSCARFPNPPPFAPKPLRRSLQPLCSALS